MGSVYIQSIRSCPDILRDVCAAWRCGYCQ